MSSKDFDVVIFKTRSPNQNSRITDTFEGNVFILWTRQKRKGQTQSRETARSQLSALSEGTYRSPASLLLTLWNATASSCVGVKTFLPNVKCRHSYLFLFLNQLYKYIRLEGKKNPPCIHKTYSVLCRANASLILLSIWASDSFPE